MQTGARLSPWVHSTYSPSSGKKEKREEGREGKEMAHLHQRIPSPHTRFSLNKQLCKFLVLFVFLIM